MKTIKNKVNCFKQLAVFVCAVSISAITGANKAEAVTVTTPVVAAIIAPITTTIVTPTGQITTFVNSPKVGQSVTFDGSKSICNSTDGCSYTWQWYWRDGTVTHLGGQIGRTRVANYAFSALAASHPNILVTLTVGAGRVKKTSTSLITMTVKP